MTTTTTTSSLHCELKHQGSAAAVSGNQMITWIKCCNNRRKDNSNNNDNDTTTTNNNNNNNDNDNYLLAYASHGLIHIVNTNYNIKLQNGQKDILHQHYYTLRTSFIEKQQTATNTSSSSSIPIVITAIASAAASATTTTTTTNTNTNDDDDSNSNDDSILVVGYSNGMVVIWKQQNNDEDVEWEEYLLQTTETRSITALDIIIITNNSGHNNDNDNNDNNIWIAVGNSNGTTLYCISININDDDDNDNNSDNNDNVNNNNNNNNTLKIISTINLAQITTHNHHLLGSTNALHFSNDWMTTSDTNNNNNMSLLFVGTASPKHNKIHVYTIHNNNNNNVQYAGCLTGHEDWITCLSMCPTNHILASSSQDAKIRLWKFKTTITNTTNTTTTTTIDDGSGIDNNNITDDDDDDDDDDEYDVDDNDYNNDDIEQDEEHESRMEIYNNNNNTKTSIILDTILYGHEENVTSVCWHPKSKQYYNKNSVLISCSMDRSIWLWAEEDDDDNNDNNNNNNNTGGGIWIPISRVGSAGGILGGSIASSLLGFCNVTIHPSNGTTMIAHAYGGSLHVWNAAADNSSIATTTNDNDMIISQEKEKEEKDCNDTIETENNSNNTKELEKEEEKENQKKIIQWIASPCITGHFAGVTDLCWEAEYGDYLLTVSIDQTCRLWGEIVNSNNNSNSNSNYDTIWMELARPQVHGYNLSTITSLSTSKHRTHVLATGADEKEIRIFDATNITLRMLKAANGIERIMDDDNNDDNDNNNNDESTKRVERAFIPSLGLSNKASAADAAEEDDDNNDKGRGGGGYETTIYEKMKLPLERDLGAVSLWPEIQKLYGHNTEIYCLTSTLTAQTSPMNQQQKENNNNSNNNRIILMASAAKARDVDDASIRLWDIKKTSYKCIQILSGGHKSTIATLCFSPNGYYLASSGKDRRLCIWKQQQQRQSTTTNESNDNDLFTLAWGKNTAHKRIIWSVHFCPFDSTILASGSRDGCVKIWKIIDDDNNSTDNAAELNVQEIHSFSPTYRNCNDNKPDSVTALSFAPLPIKNDNNDDTALLALGLESGRIELWKIPIINVGANNNNINNNETIILVPEQIKTKNQNNIYHIATITKLAWRPIRESTQKIMHLASASMDNSCCIFEIKNFE